jgi:hypothetical protein
MQASTDNVTPRLMSMGIAPLPREAFVKHSLRADWPNRRPSQRPYANSPII